MDISGPSSLSVNLGGWCSWPIIDGHVGHSLHFVGVVREVVMCDIMFITSSNWDVSNCILILNTVSSIGPIAIQGV